MEDGGRQASASKNANPTLGNISGIPQVGRQLDFGTTTGPDVGTGGALNLFADALVASGEPAAHVIVDVAGYIL